MIRHLPLTLLLALLLAFPDGARAADVIEGEHVFIVYDYRFEGGPPGSNADEGLALCANRCNALSVDYRSYTEPGGWRFVRIASGVEKTVPLGSPFLAGQCVCTVDEYVVAINEFMRPKPYGSPTER